MGKLYRRKGSPFWWARWHDAGGALQRASTKTSDRRVATLWLSAREAEVIKEHAGVPVARRIALADAVGEYLDAHRTPVWSGKWHYVVSHWWRARLLPMLGPETPTDAVARESVDQLRVSLLSVGLRPPTVNRLGAVGSGFYRWAVRRGYALSNPFSGHDRFAEVKATPPPLTEERLRAFLDAIPNPVIRRAAVVALDTGLRFSEIRRIRPQDIHGRELHVASSYARGLTKNARERWVLLSRRAQEALAAQQSAAPDLFGSMPVNVRKSLHAAQRASGTARFRWHDLRHYALTRAAGAGVQPHHLRGMAGWVGDESGRYIHHEARGMAAFVDAVDRQCAPSVQESGLTPQNPERPRDTDGD